jgi:trehalose 6-phosphate phosphatase
MSQFSPLDRIEQGLAAGGRLHLFLDYDGTLVPIAPTPEQAQPDADLLDLLTRLGQATRIRTIILSGRPLASLQAMLLVPGLTLAGTYGIEIQLPDGIRVTRVEETSIRAQIAKIDLAWHELIPLHWGFLIENKGLSIALHARFVHPEMRDAILPRAERIARQHARLDIFRILSDTDFLEIAPRQAHKGKAVEWFLGTSPLPNELLAYFGDDDKDAEAFTMIQHYKGYAIQVGTRYQFPDADAYIASSEIVRDWLKRFRDVVSQVEKV